MKVETIKHTDVRGKIQLYLKITNEGKEVLINIGQKTFDSINDVLTEATKKEKNGKPNKMEN